MSLAEEIKRMLTENPNILVEVLLTRPEIIYQALTNLTLWQELVTKKDLEGMRKEIGDVRKELEQAKKVMATKEELDTIREELEEVKKNMATKDDIKGLQASISTLIARLGGVAEDASRKGPVDLLAEMGETADREFLFDREGHVHGYPSDIEINVVIKDGKVTINMGKTHAQTRSATHNDRVDISDAVKSVNVSGLVIIGVNSEDEVVELIHFIIECTSIRTLLLSTRLDLLRKLDKEIRSGALNSFYIANYEIKSKEDALKVANLIMHKIAEIVEQYPKVKTMAILYDFNDISEKDNVKKIIVNQWRDVIPLYNVKFLVIDSSLSAGRRY